MKLLFLIFSFLISFNLQAAYMSPPSSSSPTTPPPTHVKPKPKPKPKVIMHPSERARPRHPTGELFYHPGVLRVSQNGSWMGADNFTNISKNIAVQVNIIKPTDFNAPLNTEGIRKKIVDIFTTASINVPTGSGNIGKPLLPFLEMQIMLFPVKDGFVAACYAHLFEAVTLPRITLGVDDVFQAITWEEADLVVGPAEQMEKLIYETVEAIANNFVRRLATYQAAPTNIIPPETEGFEVEVLPPG